jgi:hypothetical protein
MKAKLSYNPGEGGERTSLTSCSCPHLSMTSKRRKKFWKKCQKMKCHSRQLL